MKRIKIFVYPLILVGIVISALTHFGWCTLDGCNQLLGIGIFNISLSIWGVIFFLTLGILIPFTELRLLLFLKTTLLASALGVEITLIYIQWITEFCPLCLGVTFIVFALCIKEAFEMILQMKRLKPKLGFVTTRSFLIIAGLATGVLVSQEIKKELNLDVPAPGVETAMSSESIPCIGKECDYPVMRIYSDYFCLACRRQEPVINEVIEACIDETRIYFCDLPTHGNTSKMYIANFIACLLGSNDSDNILNARDILFELASQEVNNGSSIKACLEANGVCMNFDATSINECFQKYRALAMKDGVNTTPTVVIEGKDGKKAKFKGRFTKEQILSALNTPGV
jgi:protein-disulfide isomerase